ncbi:MAG: fumarate reductase subunit C [Nocardioides sp.]
MNEDLTYKRPVSTWWWLRKRSYFLFVMRELSSIFVAWLVLYLLLFVRAVFQGEDEYRDFLDRASSGPLLVLNVVAFAFLLLHTVTWFGVTPQAMDLRLRGQKVPTSAVLGAQYVALAVVSGFVFWLVAR